MWSLKPFLIFAGAISSVVAIPVIFSLNNSSVPENLLEVNKLNDCKKKKISKEDSSGSEGTVRGSLWTCVEKDSKMGLQKNLKFNWFKND